MKSTYLAGTAVALLWLAVPAAAQQKQEGGAQGGQGQPRMEAPAPKGDGGGAAERQDGASKSAPKDKANRAERPAAGKSAQSEGKASGDAPGRKGEAKKGSGREPNRTTQSDENTTTRSKTTPGKKAAEGKNDSRDRKAASDGKTAPKSKAAEQALPDTGTTAQPKSAETPPAPGTAKQATTPSNGASKSAQEGSGANSTDGGRAQLTEQQRNDLHQRVQQTVTTQRNVNRVARSRVNVDIRIGSRIPRSVRLVALPATLVAIVPATYRQYRYVVIDDEFCIVDPGTYEIVDVVAVSGPRSQTAQGPRSSNGTTVALVLSDREREIVLRDINVRSDSTLGLGAFAEGAILPESAELIAFPADVVRDVPKLKGYRYFTAENRIAIVPAETRRVLLVIGPR